MLNKQALKALVYCLLLLINTSVIAMNYGFRVSTKSWPYQQFLIHHFQDVLLSLAGALPEPNAVGASTSACSRSTKRCINP